MNKKAQNVLVIGYSMLVLLIVFIIFAVIFSVETGVATFTLVLFGIIAELFGLRLSMLMTTGITLLGIISAYFIRQSSDAPEKALEIEVKKREKEA